MRWLSSYEREARAIWPARVYLSDEGLVVEGGATQFQQIRESLENAVLLTGMTHWQIATLALKEYLSEYLPIPTDDA